MFLDRSQVCSYTIVAEKPPGQTFLSNIYRLQIGFAYFLGHMYISYWKVLACPVYSNILIRPLNKWLHNAFPSRDCPFVFQSLLSQFCFFTNAIICADPNRFGSLIHQFLLKVPNLVKLHFIYCYSYAVAPLLIHVLNPTSV